MSTVELLHQVKLLSARERKKFVRAVMKLEQKQQAKVARKKQEKRVVWPDVEARAKLICGDRVLPNMVLLEREESPY